jgi:hypothetical protein
MVLVQQSDGTGNRKFYITRSRKSLEHFEYVLESKPSIIQPVSYLMMPRCSERSVLPVLGSCSGNPTLARRAPREVVTNLRWPRVPPNRPPAWQIIEIGMLSSRMNPSEEILEGYVSWALVCTDDGCYQITKLDKAT